MVLLTNLELEPYHPYYQSADKDKLPVPYAHLFDDMSPTQSFVTSNSSVSGPIAGLAATSSAGSLGL